jgi:cytochrome P450
VFWYERPNVEPFWAITKHADIIEISKQPELFLNAPRLAVFTLDLPPPPEGSVRHLLNMDPPDHARYRRLASSWFTPRAIRGMDEKVARVTREVLDEAAARPPGATSCRTSRRESRSPSSPRCSACRARTGTCSSAGRTR